MMRIDRQNVQPPRSLAAGLAMSKRFGTRFRRDEDGAIMLFSFFMFMMILFIGGIGVDLMRFETERAKLQSTLDRAVLAAADIEQVRAPKEVVEDYFAKSGFAGSVGEVKFQEGLGFRSVSATASKTVSTHLIHMLGVDTLSAPAAGAAEERVDNVEISMVLDVSGSMKDNKRIENLRRAGGEFIDAVFANAEANKISVSLIPYNGQVNVGTDLIDKYNVQERHNDSYCVDLPKSVYEAIELPRTLAMKQHVAADTYNGTDLSGLYTEKSIRTLPFETENGENRWCDPNSDNRIRVHSNNVTQLKSTISALSPVGATSIDAGMRWGTALLDPSARSVVADLVGEEKVASAFSGRPLDYTDPDVLKVVVLMTDGAHFPNEFVNEGFRWGPSPVYRSDMDSKYSIHHPNHPEAPYNRKYWVPHTKSWQAGPWTGSTSKTTCGWWSCQTTVTYGTAVQQTWPDIWKSRRVAWVAQQLYAIPLKETYSFWLNAIKTREGVLNWVTEIHQVNTMDNRLLNLCQLAKQQGVVVYTIAFEAPTRAGTLLQNCASSINHAFDVDGLEISSAFASIATSIRKLRLTQ